MSESAEQLTGQAPAQTVQEKLLPSVICPHCHQKFKYEDTLWVASHPDLKGDLLLGPNAMARFRPTRFNIGGEAIDPKNTACREMACPHCHMIFPRILLENDPLYISLVGAPFSGKTTLLASTIAQQRIDFPRDFSLTFGEVDIAANKFMEPYEACLTPGSNLPGSTLAGTLNKNAGFVPPTAWPGPHYIWTKLKENETALAKPLLYLVRPEGNHPNSHNSEVLSRTVCYYDNSGANYLPSEDGKSQSSTSHLLRSKMLMVMIDPTQIPGLREKISRVSQDPQLTKGPVNKQETMIREVAQRIRNYSGLSASQRIDKPVLVILPKADLWLGMLGEDISKSPYVPPSASGAIKCHRLDLGRIESLSDKLDAWVKSNAPEINSALKESFSNIRYLPVSATGTSPVLTNGKYVFDTQTLSPQWVCVPLLYAFARFSTTMVVGTGVTA